MESLGLSAIAVYLSRGTIRHDTRVRHDDLHAGFLTLWLPSLYLRNTAVSESDCAISYIIKAYTSIHKLLTSLAKRRTLQIAC